MARFVSADGEPTERPAIVPVLSWANPPAGCLPDRPNDCLSAPNQKAGCLASPWRPGATGLNAARFQGALAGIEASFRDLFAFRDRYAPGVPIFAHNYDFAIPNGAHPACAGPWLKPSLDYCGWNVQQGTLIVRQALTDFSSMLTGLAAPTANNNFTLVNTQGTLQPDDWANELHPYPNGFKSLAAHFVQTLRAPFPGRI